MEEAIHSVPQCPVREDLNIPPTEEEVCEALGCLKVSGKNRVLPAMIRSCGEVMVDNILELLQTVWREQKVPEEWRDAMLIPIPKKGDSSHCDNWRSISLLDVMGKVFAKVIQRRLQVVVEDSLPDSQCGFRSGRGCVDMIFCARQLVEKAREHNTKLFMLFVDLRKAYDFVPWSLLMRM